MGHSRPASLGAGAATPRVILMGLGMLPGTAFLSLVTLCVLTTCYCSRFVESSPRQPVPSRRPRSRELGLYRQSAAGKSPVPGMLRSKNSLNATFESAPSQAQQRWAERPVHASFPIIIVVTASSHAFIPPTLPSHSSAHRYCSWNPSVFDSLTPSRRVTWEGVEATELCQGVGEAGAAEPLTFRILNSFKGHGHLQGRRQVPNPAPSRNLSPGRADLVERAGGRSVRNRVKTLDPVVFVEAGFTPAFYRRRPMPAKRPLCLLVEFSPILCRPPKPWRSISCPSRAGCRQAGDS